MNLLLALVVTLWIWSVVAAIRITRDRYRRGYPINVVFIGVYILMYVHEYRKLTRAETGRTGPLFFHYVVPLNLALVLTVILLAQA